MFDKKISPDKIRHNVIRYRDSLPCKTLYVLLDDKHVIADVRGVVALTPREVKAKLLDNLDPSDWFVYALEHSSLGVPIIEQLIERKIKFLPIKCAEVGGYAYDNHLVPEVLERQLKHQKELGYAKFSDPGSRDDFVNLCQALENAKNLPGDVIEIGCFRGSSGSVMLDYARTVGIDKTFWFLDVFTGFDYAEAQQSSDQFWINSHKTEGPDAVGARLRSQASDPSRVHVIKSNVITDELPSEITEISLCNLDVDLFEAVEAGLYRVAPLMVTGGILICEDAGHTPALIGARVALERFLRSDQGKKFTPVHMPSGQVFLIRHS
jgi:hypothetical protein